MNIIQNDEWKTHVTLSEANVAELAALVALKHAGQAAGRMLADRPILYKNTSDGRLLVVEVEDNAEHYADRA